MLEQRRPDALVLIDYPGFNLRTAKVARSLGIPVIYYISPQIWVWHQGRIKTIAENVTKMLVILPFEQDLYTRAGLRSVFVGHPLQDNDEPIVPAAQIRSLLQVPIGARLIGLLPGSRRAEIERHLPMLLKAASQLKQKLPDLEFVLPRAATIPRSFLEQYVAPHPLLNVRIVEKDLKSVRAAMDFAICKSGTSTLELALLGVPMVIFYKVSAITYLFAKMVVRIKWIGLVNILAGREVAPELIQRRANSREIAQTAEGIISDPARLEQMRLELDGVRQQLGGPGAARRVAQEIAATLKN
jgi:lipid-A-disaccharide synthase